ncbi:hypothetical protein [Pseudorhodoferax sp.]|uniref:hypothetical protein n=1 Tax=Pseudorhodoferax sp. TaxID=1993553 RepID=UPI0039E6F7E9
MSVSAPQQPALLSFGLACALAVGAAAAQAQVLPAAPDASGIDSSGSYASERAACLEGATPQARDTCLREAANAAAARKSGELRSPGAQQMAANAMRRCDALGGEDHAACAARVLGYGSQSGSVGGGGVIRQVETVVVPPGQGEVTIEPKTDNPVLVVPR